MMAHPVRREPYMRLLLAVCGPEFTKFCRYVREPSQLKRLFFRAFRPVSRRYLSLSRDVVAKPPQNWKFFGPTLQGVIAQILGVHFQSDSLPNMWL